MDNAQLLEDCVQQIASKVNESYYDLVALRDKFEFANVSAQPGETITVTKADFCGLMFAINALLLFKVGGKI